MCFFGQQQFTTKKNDMFEMDFLHLIQSKSLYFAL